MGHIRSLVDIKVQEYLRNEKKNAAVDRFK